MLRYMFFTCLTGVLIIAVLTLTTLGYEKAMARMNYYDYLDEALHAPKAVKNNVQWEPSETPLVRPFTQVDERKIGKAISEAWSAFAVAQDIGETTILPDYFTGIALERAQLAATQAATTGTAMVVLQSKGEPEFYHLDGSVFQARFQSLGIRFAIINDELQIFHATRDNAITTLMNESTGWRIFSHERLNAEPVIKAPRIIPDIKMAGLNYYPAQTPWRAFWTAFDIDVITADFDAITALNGNAVRIFLPREQFLSDNAKLYLDRLEQLLERASERDLYVIPTLFDLKGDYALSGWSEDAAYLGNVLPVLAKHNSVAYLDIKNEPDLDFNTHGKGQVEAWLRTMILLCQDIAPNLAVTVGWSAAKFAPIISEYVDLITYHDYQPVDGTFQRLSDVRAIAGDKPVMITEIGESTWSAFAGWPRSPTKQVTELSKRLAALFKADGVFIWTLHDFPNPDPVAVGQKPWVRKTQSEFGLYDKTGAPKPAAQTVADWFYDFTKGTLND